MQNFRRRRVVLIECAADDLTQSGFEFGQQFLSRGRHIARRIAFASCFDSAELFHHGMKLVRLRIQKSQRRKN